jgi:hypothetical protein
MASAKNFKMQSEILTLRFQSKQAAEHFKHWLCGQGEQDYWIWMQEREQREKGDITGLRFDYWQGDIVDVKCGRLDKKGG